jgi:hypothetical protein
MLDPRDIPTPTIAQRRVFAVMLALFFALLGWLADAHPAGLRIAAIITAAAAIASMLFNRDLPLRLQALGLVIPGVLAMLSVMGLQAGGTGWLIVWIGGLGVLPAVMVWTHARFGRAFYSRWLLAAMPIGWSVAALVLMLIYYLVVTPIGLVMRFAGRDAMERRFDPAASTYWRPHQPVSDKTRYFRQY